MGSDDHIATAQQNVAYELRRIDEMLGNERGEENMIIDDATLRALVDAAAFDIDPFGCAHIVVEDGNVEDYHIDHCIIHCMANPVKPDGISPEWEGTVPWLRVLKLLSLAERGLILTASSKRAHMPFDPEDALDRRSRLKSLRAALER